MTVYTGRNFSTKIVSGNVTVSLMSYPRKPSDLPSLHMRKKDIKKKNSHHLFLIKYEAVSMFGSHISSHFYCCLFTVGYRYSFLFI